MPTTFSVLPERLVGLGEIASNLWWSWHPAARMLFKTINRAAWKESRHNPVKMLREVPPQMLAEAAKNPEYLKMYDEVLARFRREMAGDARCFGEAAASSSTISFFSAEYGLHHSLPFYAGGLGFLAGDYLKECSDLGVPLVAIGFMYPEGYVRQRIREDGWQESMDELLERDAASIARVLQENGVQLTVRVPLIDPPIYVAVWKIAVGKVPLYLMDTDIPLNDPWNRRISSHLYIGDREQRLRQEIVLGIGGSALLGAMGIKPAVMHLNEGHAAFALLERLREMVQNGMSFAEAAATVRRTSLFTSHTPVAAGHDVFSFPLIEKYFRSYWPGLGVDHDTFLQLGINPAEPHAGFNMTVLALKLSDYRNAVSRRHGETARKMWHSLWPDLPVERVPIDYVTNGIHVPTWIEPKMELLFNRYLGDDWLAHHEDPAVWQKIDTIPDLELWLLHCWLKMKLINTIREQVRQKWVQEKVTPTFALAGGTLLDPTVLTIGFARRFTGYKRAYLILQDVERLKRMLNDRWRPVQIIFAGKAHPDDDEGKRIIQRIFQKCTDPAMGGRIALVENYDEQLAQYMVHGVDIWLNNPLPPLEACGTSGMKAALNGVPHLSILDGWWIEAYNGRNGWAFGGEVAGENRDPADAEAIYNLLESQIIPLYYDVAENGTSPGWLKVMKEAIQSNFPRFSARRMVREYNEKFYTPALRKA
ncbi:MAG TPA: alpha-glucan family phosphorylase [Syntrophales bacterium]|nr:alpha-glucan family phosphorylase [Syntrophales bacterium]